MIHSITVTNNKNESLVLELRRPEKSGLIIKNIDGLGPSKANINVTDLATIDGGIYSSSKVTERNIVITLILLESPTIEEARLRTYRYFPIKKPVTFKVTTDNREAEVLGYVESHTPVIFSEQEETQISILCPDPFFYESGNEERVFSGVEPLFEFPFSNESLTENLIQFGEIKLDTSATLVYNGDVDTGIVMTAHVLNLLNEDITIFNNDTREQMSISMERIMALTGSPLSAGDDLIISTVRGNKYARLLRNGIYSNMISAISKDADWFQISAGDNVFSFNANGEESNLMLTFFYRNAYGGV